jgi:hypothetical protein
MNGGATSKGSLTRAGQIARKRPETMLKVCTPRNIVKFTFDLMQLSAEALGSVLCNETWRAALNEFHNKLQVFTLFEYVDAVLGLPVGQRLPLLTLVARTETLDPYTAVWVTEGIGHYYAERHWEHFGAPSGLLTDQYAGALRGGCLIPLHAGMGLSLAHRVLTGIPPHSGDREIRRALLDFLNLCRNNSKEGYVGAAFESLGLVTRTLYPHLVAIIDRELCACQQSLAAHFWHGIGRALYFAPSHFLPCCNSFWLAIDASQREAPHDLGKLNAFAGLAWAMTLVNIRQPEIIESLLRFRPTRLINCDAFANGVGSAIIVWQDAAENDRSIDRLCQHRPSGSSPGLAGLWNRCIKEPAFDAVHRFYAVLKRHCRFDEVFRHQSLEALIARLDA